MPVAIRLLRGAPIIAAYLSVAVLIIYLLPDYERGITLHSLTVIGIIGAWRYTWMIIHIIRSFLFEFVKFPKIRHAANTLPEAEKYPDKLFCIVPTWKEKPEVVERSLNALLDESATVPTKIYIVINSGSEEEDELYRTTHLNHINYDAAEMMFIRQEGGKRQGMSDVLAALSHYDIDIDDVIALMDGDTLLGNGNLEKCLPLFKLNPKLGAVTTDNIAVTTGNWFYRNWYTLRFAMRHRLMKSLSLSDQLMVLTGRFSLVRAHFAVRDDFITMLENDRIKHWLHGEIKFVTGDDKSTWYSLLQEGAEMWYVPDTHIYCMEDSGTEPFWQSVQKMHRWFGNMLRNNGRAIRMGIGSQKPFIWMCAVDQRLSMFTTLLGPIAAIWGTLFFSWHYLFLYIIIVIVVRTLYLIIMIFEGHRMTFFDIFMLLYTQWGGSAVKIFTLFHLHKQKWDSHRTNMEDEKRTIDLVDIIPKAQIVLVLFTLITFVALMLSNR